MKNKKNYNKHKTISLKVGGKDYLYLKKVVSSPEHGSFYDSLEITYCGMPNKSTYSLKAIFSDNEFKSLYFPISKKIIVLEHEDFMGEKEIYKVKVSHVDSEKIMLQYLQHQRK